MIKALKQPQLKRLWLGQATSSIGDELYRVSLTWFAVGLMGANTGYLTAGQTAALMLLSFFGGKWADQWHPLHTMIRVDLARAVIVSIPVIVYFFRPVPIALLWVIALSLSGLSAFFDPATQALIPILARTPEMMKSTNGLMSTTIRLARMLGPAIVGLFAAIVPMIHFFTMDAITFLVSAYSVSLLRKDIPDSLLIQKKETVSFKDAITSGIHLVRTRPGMSYVFFAKSITAGTWNLALMIGFALLIHQVTNGNAKSFGLVMASYGVGNFIGALYFGSLHRVRLWTMFFAGLACLGLGFVLIGLAPTVNLIMLAAAMTGLAGPMNDLALVDMLQQRFEVDDLAKIFRLRIAVETSGTLFFTAISPWLIKATSVRLVIMGCGVVWIFAGIGGLLTKPNQVSCE